MVWAGVSYDGRTDLHIIRNGTINAQRYRDDILEAFVKPYAGAVGETFVLIDDNARLHRARIIDDYLETEAIDRMEWPAYSPDINPIEHAWDTLQRAIQAMPVAPGTLLQLETALKHEWNNIPKSQLKHLVASLQRRCQAVIAARGGPNR